MRLGAFRSVNDQKHAFQTCWSTSSPTGRESASCSPIPSRRVHERRASLTQSIPDGPRLHVIHLSLRSRNARREFGGSEFISFGPGRIGEHVHAPEPDHFNFGELSHDRLKQTTLGVAYDGRWKDVGEISFGISQANYRKDTVIPDEPVAMARSKPLLQWDGSREPDQVAHGLCRLRAGLEETGTAPPNAANRNQPLPAILTEQKDAGVRFAVTKDVKAVVGVFDLSRPYFGFDANNVFKQIGTVRSRGAEFSVLEAYAEAQRRRRRGVARSQGHSARYGGPDDRFEARGPAGAHSHFQPELEDAA